MSGPLLPGTVGVLSLHTGWEEKREGIIKESSSNRENESKIGNTLKYYFIMCI